MRAALNDFTCTTYEGGDLADYIGDYYRGLLEGLLRWILIV